MTTLTAMIGLFDGYSSTIAMFSLKTEEATEKILKASGATEELSDKLKDAGASAEKASGGLKKFFTLANVIDIAKKGMNLTDEFTKSSMMLTRINSDLSKQAELQDKIFGAANRSRGTYSDMVGSVSRLSTLTGDTFKNEDETIAFAELTQKSFKAGGTDEATQAAGMEELYKGMESGTIKEDQFEAITQSAPLILEAVKNYTGKSGEEIVEMAKKGDISAEIMKNALIGASDNIGKQFGALPMTFEDVWNRIKNSALNALAPIMEGVSELVNTTEFKTIVDGLIVAFGLLSMAASGFLGLIKDNWPLILSILLATGLILTATLLPGFIKAGLVGLMSGLTAAKGWIAAYAPMILIIGLVALIILKLMEAGVTFEDIFGAIGGGISVVIEFFKNLGLTIANIALGIGAAIGALGTNIEAAFFNAISSVQSWFYNMLSTALTVVGKIAEVLNKLPFVEFDYSGISDAADYYKAKSEEAANNKKEYVSVSDAFDEKSKTYTTFKEGWIDEAYNNGKVVGENVFNDIGDGIAGIKNSITGEGYDPASTVDINKDFNVSQFEPISVEGTGKNNGVKVDMSDEDLRYLQDIAERDFINKFSTATIAPAISVNFGDVHETADTDVIAKRIQQILREEISMVGEGA